MLEKFTYTNNLGETLEFGKDCFFVNENDLRDFTSSIKMTEYLDLRRGLFQKQSLLS